MSQWNIILAKGQSNMQQYRIRNQYGEYDNNEINSFKAGYQGWGFNTTTGDPVPAGWDQAYAGVYILECQFKGGMDRVMVNPLVAEIENPQIVPYNPAFGSNVVMVATHGQNHSGGWDFAFARKEYLRTGINQLVVKCAVGGTSLVNGLMAGASGWNPAITGDNSLQEWTEREIAKAKSAIIALGGTLNSAVEIWDQGESDQTNSSASWKANFLVNLERDRIALNVNVLPVLIRLTFQGNARIAQQELIAENENILGYDFNSFTTLGNTYYEKVPIHPIDSIHLLPKACEYIGFKMSRVYDGYRYRFDNIINS